MKYILLLICFANVFLSCKEEPKKEATKPKYATLGDAYIDALTNEISNDPLNPELRYNRAEKLYARKLYDECIEDLRVAVTTDSMVPKYYHLLADAFMDNNISSRALQTMLKAGALFPNRIPTQLKLSETQLILEKYDDAINTLNLVVKQDPNNAEAFFMLGMVLKAKGEDQRAINLFQTAVEMDAKLIDGWINLGNLYMKLKNPKALTYFQNAVNIDPKNPNALHALAYYNQETNKIDEAIKLYKQIHLIDKNYADAYLNCGILYYDLDSLPRAKEEFTILIGIAPKDWNGYFYRGLVNYYSKDYEAALADLQTSVNFNDKNEEAKELIKLIKEKQK